MRPSQPSDARLPSRPPRIWTLVSGAEMRRLDRYTIETCGVSGEVLMESAGRAVVDVALAELTASAANLDSVIVVCGTGNNGGDGFVVARHLHQLGVPVRVMISGDPERTRGDAAANQRRARKVGVPFVDGDGERDHDWDVKSPALVIDALFGTGLARSLGGEAAACVERIDPIRDVCELVGEVFAGFVVSLEVLVEREAGDVLQDRAEGVVIEEEVEAADQVRVADLAEDPYFAEEALLKFSAAFGADQLERDLLLELAIPGEEHAAGSAASELALDAVATGVNRSRESCR